MSVLVISIFVFDTCKEYSSVILVISILENIVRPQCICKIIILENIYFLNLITTLYELLRGSDHLSGEAR